MSAQLRVRQALRSLALLLPLLILFPVFAHSQSATGNWFVTARVEDGSGKVTIVTTEGGYYGNEKPLSYNDMSFLSVDIDGFIWTNNDVLPNGWDKSNPRYGGNLNFGGRTEHIQDTIRTTWKVPKGEIIQDVYPVAFDFSGQIVMRWRYHCLTYDVSTAKMQYLLDTHVVKNDQARVLTRYGYRNNWSLYIPNNPNYNDIPSFYQAFEHDLDSAHGFNPGVVSQGTFINADLGLIKPDAVIVGDWTILRSYEWGWPATFPPNSYGDSALLMEFGSIGAQAGQTVELGRTSYGTGEFETCTGDLYALIFRPRIIRANATGTGYKPNPFTVEMYLFNTNPYTEAAATQATLTVGPHLTILDSNTTNNRTTQTQWGNPKVDAIGGVSVCTWHVFAEKTCDPDTSFLTFTAKCNLADPSFTSVCKLPVTLPCLDRDTLPPLSYPVVSNGFSKSMAFDDNRPKDKGLDKILTTVTPASASSNFYVTIDPYQPCTHGKVWVNIRQQDSTIAGCVNLQAIDCAGNSTFEQICFDRYPPHPDTVAPRIRLLRTESSFDGSRCNMKYDSLLAVDDTTYDLGLASITLTPGFPSVNMSLDVQQVIKGASRLGFAIHVLDSMVDGAICIRVKDVAGNFTDDTIYYCTIPDRNPPKTTVIQTGPYEWSVFAEDNNPYDRKIDTISVHNRVNVDLYKNSVIFEPTRSLTRGQSSFVFRVVVHDTLHDASFCVRTKDLADSTSANLDKANWWSADTCLSRQPGKDIYPPNISLSPSPLTNPIAMSVQVDDIHRITSSVIIGWDKGIDKVWFDKIDGYTVPDTVYGNCAMTLPPFIIRVTDPTAIKSISSVCIHAIDCAGNQTDTCIYYPVKPDTLAPYIWGQQPTRTEIDLSVTDSTLFDRGLSHLILKNIVNLQPFEHTVPALKYDIAPIRVIDPTKSAVGRLEATDQWGVSSGRTLDLIAHTTGIDLAFWVQDVAMDLHTLAQQDSDVSIPVKFVQNDTFALARKNITQFSFSFDLVGDPNFAFARVDNAGTASALWSVNGSQTGSRVTITGSSKDGTPLSQQSLPLIKVVMHAGKNENTRLVTLLPVTANNASMSFNGDRTTTVTEGTHAIALLPAPSGTLSGTNIIVQGSCSPALSVGATPKIASLDNVSPNPFTSTTELSYAVPQTGYASLIVYNALGNEVTRLVNTIVEAGYHTASFNGAGLPAGVYYVRLETAGSILSKKMNLQK